MNTDVFSPSPVLHNERATLLPLHWSHLHALAQFVIHEPEIWTYGLMQPSSHQGMVEYVARAMDQRAQQQVIPFSILDCRSDQIAGSTRFYEIGTDSVSIGYTWLGKQFQGSGLNAAIKKLMLDYAFTDMRKQEVHFHAQDDNQRSRAAIEKLGAVYTGIRYNSHVKPDGTLRNTVDYVLSKKVWQSA